MSDDLECKHCHHIGDESVIDPGSNQCWDEEACNVRISAEDEYPW